MRYLGSKAKLLVPITDLVGDAKFVCDLFSGTGIVSHYLRGQGKLVTANDTLEMAYMRARALVMGTMSDISAVEEVISGWNKLSPISGSITRLWGETYFSISNAQKIDAALNDLIQRDFSDTRRAICITSIIDAMDSVANTAGTYSAYLKGIQPNARRHVYFKVPYINTQTDPGLAYRMDANALVRQVKFQDVYYIDPPYNHRQYPAFYHIPEFICRWLRNTAVEFFVDHGITHMLDYEKSFYCLEHSAEAVLRDLLDSIDARVILSYSNEGIVPIDSIMSMRNFKSRVISHRRYNGGELKEYLFYD